MGANERQEGGDHYKAAKVQHWDLVAQNRVGYLEGNATKYLTRWRKKNGLEDLKKALHYVDKLFELARDEGLDNRSAFATDPTRHDDAWAMLEQFFVENQPGATEEFIMRILFTWEDTVDINLARQSLQVMIQEQQS